jgi:hypothetical protein
MLKTKTLNFATALVIAIVVPSFAGAQGNPTGNTSDVSGASVTGGDVAGGVFAPSSAGGTTPALASATAQAAVVAASATVNTALVAGSLVSVSGAAISPAAQALILAVISGNAVATGPAADLTRELSAAGGPASAMLPGLLESLAGLATSPSQLAPAIGSYNGFVNAASAQFLANPPQAFIAVQAVLAQLSSAARSVK